MARLPKLKKKISSFLSKEDGKISKEKIIKAGVVLATMSLGAASVKADGAETAEAIVGATGTLIDAGADIYDIVANGADVSMEELTPEGHLNDLFMNSKEGKASATHVHSGWHYSY